MHTESHNTAREVREPQVYGNNTKYVNLISYTKVLNVRQGKEHKCNIGAPMNCFEMKILYLYDIFKALEGGINYTTLSSSNLFMHR